MGAGDIFAERFVLEAEIARGGPRVVYRGWDLDASTPVAVKILSDLDADELVRFEREASLLAATRLEGVVRYIAHGPVGDGSQFLVTEWLEGETLARRLERRGLDISEAVAMVRSICAPLAALHAQGLIHRDIKPANLVFTGDRPDEITVIDFGLARRASDASTRITGTGQILGTIGYMSPEQARGDREIGPAADVFAIGCVLYRCLTGLAPFAGDNHIAILYKILVSEPPPLALHCPECPAELAALVRRLLSKDPRERPRDAAELSQVLTNVVVPANSPRRPNPAGDVTTRLTSRTMADLPVLIVDCGDQPIADVIIAARPEGGRCERTSDGLLLFTLGPQAAPGALHRLVAFALDAAHLAPGAVMALGVDPDRTGALLERVARAAMFSDHQQRRIAVDPDAVARLGDAFEFERALGTWLLVATGARPLIR